MNGESDMLNLIYHWGFLKASAALTTIAGVKNIVGAENDNLVIKQEYYMGNILFTKELEGENSCCTDEVI
jgi:hypothetical protein